MVKNGWVKMHLYSSTILKNGGSCCYICIRKQKQYINMSIAAVDVKIVKNKMLIYNVLSLS